MTRRATASCCTENKHTKTQGVISTLQHFFHPLGFLCLCGRAVDHPPHQSVLQVLEIEDPVVANCLIDMRGIESILLFMVR